MPGRISYVWDYDIDETVFRDILAGRSKLGRLDRRWAAVRLLEYAPYREVIRLLASFCREPPEFGKVGDSQRP